MDSARHDEISVSASLPLDVRLHPADLDLSEEEVVYGYQDQILVGRRINE